MDLYAGWVREREGELTCDSCAGVQGAPVAGAQLQRYGAGGCGRPVQRHRAAGGDGGVAACGDFEGIRAGGGVLGGDEGAESGGDEGD